MSKSFKRFKSIDDSILKIKKEYKYFNFFRNKYFLINYLFFQFSKFLFSDLLKTEKKKEKKKHKEEYNVFIFHFKFS